MGALTNMLVLGVSSMWKEATGKDFSEFTPSGENIGILRQAIAAEKAATLKDWQEAPLYKKASAFEAIEVHGITCAIAELGLDILEKVANHHEKVMSNPPANYEQYRAMLAQNLPFEQENMVERSHLIVGQHPERVEKSALLMPGEVGYADQFIHRLKARLKQASGDPMADAEVDALYEEHKHDAITSGRPMMSRDFFERSVKDPNLANQPAAM